MATTTLAARQGRAATCDGCPVRTLGICAHLDPEIVSALRARSQRVHFAPGRTILSQSDRNDRLGIVVSGLCRIVHVTEDGDEQVLQILSPGELVGTPVGEASFVSCEAATDVTLCWLPRTAFDALAEEHPDILRAFLAEVVRQLEDQHRWSARRRGRHTVERVAVWIADRLAAREGDARPVVEVELKRRDLASFLEMSVETLCRGLHQLADEGAIRLLAPDRIEVVDGIRLHRLAGHDCDLCTAPRAARAA